MLKESQLKRKNTRIKNGSQLPDELVSDYRKYRLEINRSLQRNKKIILDNWNGFDYYDNEYIKDNFSLSPKDRNYPHFDHKISVIYGFNNNLSTDIISNIDNICITKQHINGLKKGKCEKEFIYEKTQSQTGFFYYFSFASRTICLTFPFVLPIGHLTPTEMINNLPFNLEQSNVSV